MLGLDSEIRAEKNFALKTIPYAYCLGVHVQISTHDPADYLHMADESFRVAPGYQTNVAVYVHEVGHSQLL